MNINTKKKLCSRCAKWRGALPLDAFDKDSRSADKRRGICKTCRKEQRLQKLAQSQNGVTPKSIGAPKITAETSPKRFDSADKPPKNKKAIWDTIRNRLPLFWLGAGGFVWSVFNGSFAFYETAKSFLPKFGYVIAVLAASVLTLGTAVSASWSVKFIQQRQKLTAVFMVLICVFTQGLNLIVNHAGVRARLSMAQRQEIQANEQTGIDVLKTLKADYQKTIDKYPPTDENGKPVVWKSQITEIVRKAHSEIRRLNAEIEAKEMHRIEPAIKLDWRIVTAWLVLPECCLLIAVLVFAVGFSKDNEPTDSNLTKGDTCAEK